MSKAEELLNSVSTEVPVHSHPVPDTDTYFIIDPINRRIENTNRKKTVIMQYDHNSERFTFGLPRYIDGHDMLQCTSVTVNCDNIETETGTTNSDAPDMTDLRVDPENPDMVISSWLISRNLTQLAGILSFSIEYKCVDSNGNVVYEWSTDVFDDIDVKARKKNGEAAVIEHTNLLEQWRTQIFGAGDSVIANIAAEGETRVAAIKAESETQQEAVELKGANTLETIPEDYTETNEMASEAVRTKADAIVCEAEGKVIAITDSSDDYIRGFKLFGKTTQVTTTGKNQYDLSKGYAINKTQPFTVSAGDYYTVAVYPSAGTYQFNVKVTYDNGAYDDYAIFYTDADNKKWYMLSQKAVANIVSISFYNAPNGADNRTIDKIAAYYGQMDEFTDDDYEPYTGGKPAPNPEYPQDIINTGSDKNNIGLVFHNGNLLSELPLSRTAAGIVGTNNGDGSYTFKGTSTGYWVSSYVDLDLPAGTYTLTSAQSGVLIFIRIFDENENQVGLHTNTFTLSGEEYRIAFFMQVEPNTTVDATIYPMLNVGTTLFTWEKGTQQTLTSQTPNGLPGIPVTTGGNYTDENGQQWICDEIDCERGVYVQRTKTVEINGSETWRKNIENASDNYLYWLTVPDVVKERTGKYLCDKLQMKVIDELAANGNAAEQIGISDKDTNNVLYINVGSHMSENTVDGLKSWLANNHLTVMYILATPIETPLTAEEIAAFKALTTNYPNTTILNDAGAWMSVKYNADTKSYVDNPKTLRLTDSSTGVVYELKVVDGAITVVPV